MSAADDALEIAVDALATFRLAKLITDDKITEDLREMVWARFGEPSDEDAHKLSYFITCPWCLSFYFGSAAIAGRMMFPRVWKPVSRALALSALTGLLAERVDQ